MENNDDYIEENGKLIPLSLIDKYIDNGFQEIDVDAISVKEWSYSPVDPNCFPI
jgi:hypothetical protein